MAERIRRSSDDTSSPDILLNTLAEQKVGFLLADAICKMASMSDSQVGITTLQQHQIEELKYLEELNVQFVKLRSLS